MDDRRLSDPVGAPRPFRPTRWPAWNGLARGLRASRQGARPGTSEIRLHTYDEDQSAGCGPTASSRMIRRGRRAAR